MPDASVSGNSEQPSHWTERGLELWEAVWGEDAGWMKMPNPDAYYASGRAESAFNLWCHENVPRLVLEVRKLQREAVRGGR